MSSGFPDTKKAQLAALRAVIDPDLYADYRKICRWFSRTFATPLADVYDLPSDFVITHYLEESYESKDHDKRRELLIELTETPDERVERLRKESAEEHESFTASKVALNDVFAKISKMRGSEIKKGLEAYRSDLAEKKEPGEEPAIDPEQALAALQAAQERPIVNSLILPGDKLKAIPPVDYPDYTFEGAAFDHLDIDSMGIPKPK